MTNAATAGPVYALNLFNVADRDEYLPIRAARKGGEAHGGRVVALGKFREAAAGDIKPRTVMILVEWASKANFDGYCNDPKMPTCIRIETRVWRLHLAPLRQLETCGRSSNSRRLTGLAHQRQHDTQQPLLNQ